MMDSQEKTLTQGNAEEVKNVDQVTETTPAAEESQVEKTEDIAKKVYASKDEVLERIKEIAHGDEAPQKSEVDHLKTAFYKLHAMEREAQQKAYLDAGGAPEAYQVMPDEKEEAFKAEMQVIKEKRA